MTWQQALDYLYAQLPMFHRIGAAAYKNNLDNSLALDALLNHPHQHFACIHIAGTNGKGSVSNMLAAIYQTAGYRTGLYTSPHLKDFRERIRINGKMINRQFIIRFIEQHRRDFETIKPSFFEWTTALAFEYFKQKKVDLAVIETGMGGRLDSTNIITPVISIITNIGWDHAHLLGNTLQKIAAEKAGIIKHGVPLVIGEKQKAIQSVFKQKAKDMNTQAVFASENFETEMKSSGFKEMKVDIMHHGKPYLKSVRMDLAGHYQLKNVCTVLQSVHLLNPKFPVKKEQIIKALKQVRKLSGFNGRWTVLAKRPLIIADTGHNKEGIAEVMKQINTITYKRLHIVLGMVADKDIASVLKLLPKTAYYYFCQPAVPRGLDAVQLAEAAAKFKLAGNTFSSVKSALKAAKKQAGNHDLIFIGGSTFVVAEII
jgi:dihydrofolate synthase/folylpolyglutamate synthase